MIFNSETRTEREISDLNKVLKETDIQQKMKEIFNKLPQSVLDAFFSSETYEHEFFFDKNGKKITGGEKVRYTANNTDTIRELTCESGYYLDINIYKDPVYDKKNPYSTKNLNEKYNLDIEEGYLPRVVLSYTASPIKTEDEDGVIKIKRKTVEKVLLVSRTAEIPKIITIEKCDIDVPEQTVHKHDFALINIPVSKEKDL